MRMKEIVRNLMRRGQGDSVIAKETEVVTKNWYTDRYETVLVQRNLFFLCTVVAVVAILFSSLLIRYIKSSKAIEPFVISIEEKTGVPTVVEPLSIKAYSANDAVVRYFIMQYIRAREEYIPSLYRYNYDTVVRVLSSDTVYYNDYRPKFSMNNPQSPVTLLANNGSRAISLKSIIFPVPGTAQVRFSLQSTGGDSGAKVVLLQYEFSNISMNEDERLINPLGFRITNYKLEDEL